MIRSRTRIPMSRINADILLIGAGIAGGAMACALRGRGYRIVVVEKSDQLLDTARGDHLQPGVVELLDQWGLLESFFARGGEKRHGSNYCTADGELLLAAELDDLPLPHPYYLYINHDVMGEVFRDVAAASPDITLLRPVRAWKFHQAPGRNLTTLDATLGNGERITVETAIVIGADGRASKVREAAGFETTEYRYENPMVAMFAPHTHEDPRNEVVVYIGDSGMTFRIPRNGGQWKIGLPIAKKDSAFWARSSAAQRREILARRAPALGELETEFAGFYPVKMINTDRWCKRNVALIGDACHTMHPARGQGMNVAIRNIGKLLGYLPAAGEIHNLPLVCERLRAYDAEQKPQMDPVLNDNHQRALQIDRMDNASAMASIPYFRAIQADPDRHWDYKMESAGY